MVNIRIVILCKSPTILQKLASIEKLLFWWYFEKYFNAYWIYFVYIRIVSKNISTEVVLSMIVMNSKGHVDGNLLEMNILSDCFPFFPLFCLLACLCSQQPGFSSSFFFFFSFCFLFHFFFSWKKKWRKKKKTYHVFNVIANQFVLT